MSVNVTQRFDDLFWRSGAAAGAWLGDIRCYTRMPATDVSVQFTLSGSRPSVTVSGFDRRRQCLWRRRARITCSSRLRRLHDGATPATVNFINGGGTGHMKFALFDDNAGAIGALLATSTEITNPPAGTAIPSPSRRRSDVTRGQTYWLAFDQDASIT